MSSPLVVLHGPGNELYLGLLCATILAMLVMCKGEDDDDDEDKPPGGMYN